MSKSYMWTLIIYDINYKYSRTNHYYTKASAIEDLKRYTSLAYTVTMLNHGIYLTNDKTKFEK